MTLLLDTHVLLWWLADHPDLPLGVRHEITRAPRCYVSAASIWEATIKRALGKLDCPSGLAAVVQTEGFDPLPVSLEHAEAVGGLPPLHGDPFDRLLIAQAQLEGLTLVTRDDRIGRYDVAVLAWG